MTTRGKGTRTLHEVVLDAPLPGTAEWRQLITASKVPAILNLSPWTSQYTLWHEMAGNVEPDNPDSDLFTWGHCAERSLQDFWLSKHPGWKFKGSTRAASREIAFTNTTLGYPNQATLDAVAVQAGTRGRVRRIVECKVTHDLSAWGRPGEEKSVPDHYRAQVIFQMLVSGIYEADVVVLCRGVPEIHRVEWDERIAEAIHQRCTEWWESLEQGVEPELDYSLSTLKTMRGLHPSIEQGVEVVIPDGLAQEYTRAAMEAKAWKTSYEKAAFRIEQLMLSEHAQYAITHSGERLASRVASRGVASLRRYTPKPKRKETSNG